MIFLRFFPLWVIVAAVVGFLLPELLVSIKSLVVPLLTGIMLCMGLTLQPRDFVEVGRYKTAILAGTALQFSVMPLMALLISLSLGLSQELLVGMVLVGSVAGGTASNVMTHLAGGNVALSVSMTAISTLLGIVMTPLLLWLLVGSNVDVPALSMLESLFKIVLLPVTAGVLLNHFFRGRVTSIQRYLAPLSVIMIVIIIAIVVALNQSSIDSGVIWIALATLLHNLSGLALGYMAAHLLGFDRVICRTIAIEVGMQNSGLATALALKFFSPISALPGAIFSIWLNITGSVFAAACTRSDKSFSKD